MIGNLIPIKYHRKREKEEEFKMDYNILISLVDHLTTCTTTWGIIPKK